MGRVFITGSTDGPRLAAAATLLEDGHAVVRPGRNPTRAPRPQRGTRARAARLPTDLGPVVIGDLSDAEETRDLARQVNELGRMSAVIHNAGVYVESTRGVTPEAHARTVAVNTLAPYILTALIDRPDRLIYLSSGMHHDGVTALDDIDWQRRTWNGTQAYCDSKLHVTAVALAVAR